MRVPIALAALLSLGGVAQARNAYHCAGLDYAIFDDDGKLGHPQNFYPLVDWADVVVDTGSGVVQRKDKLPENWKVTSPGAGDLFFEAVHGPPGQEEWGDRLMVRNPRGGTTASFIVISYGYVATGTCQKNP